MWNSPVQDRISQWRSFRSEIGAMTFHDCVHEVHRFWWTAPISNPFYSQDLPDQWPDPWQLISENHYDDIARALGMLYTIALSRHGDSCDLEIRNYRDRKNSREYNLVLIDSGKYTLNWDLEVRVNNTLQLENVPLIHSCSAKNLLGERKNNEHTNSSYETQW